MMKRTRLIQRIKAPLSRDVALSERFAFGGGGSGLNADAMRVLRPIMSFDYMGAAEFEGGSLSTAMMHIVSYAKSGMLTVGEVGGEDGTVYVLGANSDMDEIKKRVLLVAIAGDVVAGNWQSNPYATRIDLKESARLGRDGVVGGIELDNGFLYTVDAVMFEKLRTLLL